VFVIPTLYSEGPDFTLSPQIRYAINFRNIIRVINSRRKRWAGYLARMGGKRCAYRNLVERPEGRRSLGRPRRECEDNIKMDLQEVGWAWTGLSWLRIGIGGGLL
jgi:hypothetical protein